MADYIQIVSEDDMTNYKSHILLLTQMAHNNDEPTSNIKSKNKTIPAHYTLNYDVNEIKEPGVFKLGKGFYNFDNSGNVSNGNNVEWLYVTKYNDNVIRQYYITSGGGKITITTRVYFNSSWRAWRIVSWKFPKYELLLNLQAYRNTHYISFGDHTLTLPSASDFNPGDCIRLDQYAGIGKVMSTSYACEHCGYVSSTEFDTCPACSNAGSVKTEQEIVTHSTKITDQYQSNLNCEGFVPATFFEYQRFYTWVSEDGYVLSTTFVHDKDNFYWCITDDTGSLVYRSVKSITEATHPCNASQWIDDAGNTASVVFTISDRANDMSTDTCTTYIFEVLNDYTNRAAADDEYYNKYNYWGLVVCNTSRHTLDPSNINTATGFSDLKKNITDLHARLTNEVKSIVGNKIEINKDFTSKSIEELYQDLEYTSKITYLISSTDNTIEFPTIDGITYVEGEPVPEKAEKLNKIVDKTIDVIVLSSGGCKLTNLINTVSTNQTASIMLVRYTTESDSAITNHYEWLFRLQKQS